MKQTVLNKKVNLLLIFLFLVSTVGYLSTLKFRPYPFAWFTKILPLAILVIVSYYNLTGKKRALIILALLFSSIGDVFLAMPGHKYFIHGMAAFGIAHLFYFTYFFNLPKIEFPRAFIAIGIILYSISLFIFLLPNVKELLIPIISYIILISLMGISSVLGIRNNYLIILGAIIFIVSDSLIAINMFIIPVLNASFLIMLTYYVAQFLIVLGVIKSLEKPYSNINPA
jgi:uncharacterized membrane protein YhhN